MRNFSNFKVNVYYNNQVLKTVVDKLTSLGYSDPGILNLKPLHNSPRGATTGVHSVFASTGGTLAQSNVEYESLAGHKLITLDELFQMELPVVETLEIGDVLYDKQDVEQALKKCRTYPRLSTIN